MRPLCVIPARRGSKRIPEKNITDLCGRPMLAYSIEAAIASGIADEVFVSTEDEQIGSIAARYGARFHLRPDELAGDLVSAADVCLEVADRLARVGKAFDAIVCLQPSSPLRSASDVRESWLRFCEASANYLVSVTPIDPHYFHWAVHQSESEWGMYFGDRFMMERPLLPPVYRPNGAIKIGRVEPLKETRNFFGNRLEVFMMPERRSLHVAEPLDLELARCLLNDGGSAR